MVRSVTIIIIMWPRDCALHWLSLDTRLPLVVGNIVFRLLDGYFHNALERIAVIFDNIFSIHRVSVLSSCVIPKRNAGGGWSYLQYAGASAITFETTHAFAFSFLIPAVWCDVLNMCEHHLSLFPTYASSICVLRIQNPIYNWALNDETHVEIYVLTQNPYTLFWHLVATHNVVGTTGACLPNYIPRKHIFATRPVVADRSRTMCWWPHREVYIGSADADKVGGWCVRRSHVLGIYSKWWVVVVRHGFHAAIKDLLSVGCKDVYKATQQPLVAWLDDVDDDAKTACYIVGIARVRQIHRKTA